MKNEPSFEEGGGSLHCLLRRSLRPSYRSSRIRDFLFAYRYIIHANTTTMELSHPSLLVTSFLVAILVAGEYRQRSLNITYSVTTTVVLYLFRRRSKSRANCVIFVGTPDAGKTAILSTVRGVFTYAGSSDSDTRCSWHTARRFQATRRYKPMYPSFHGTRKISLWSMFLVTLESANSSASICQTQRLLSLSWTPAMYLAMAQP